MDVQRNVNRTERGINSMENRFVAYLRVSTQRQGRSGLGLESQQQMISDYLRSVNGKQCAAFTEIESGKREDRPELSKALAACRVYGACLLVAKLDRLARNSYFVEKLLHEGAEFRATDCPEASTTMVKMLSIFADYERQQISARTSAALQAKMRRGWKPKGNPDIADYQRKGSRAGNAKRSAVARQRASDLQPVIAELRSAGAVSLAQIAAGLNQRGIPTARGREWSTVQVARVVEHTGA